MKIKYQEICDALLTLNDSINESIADFVGDKRISLNNELTFIFENKEYNDLCYIKWMEKENILLVNVDAMEEQEEKLINLPTHCRLAVLKELEEGAYHEFEAEED